MSTEANAVENPPSNSGDSSIARWQRIETSPKDGTWFLTYRERDGQSEISSARWLHAELGGRGWCYCTHEGFPTHWMPLPSPPTD